MTRQCYSAPISRKCGLFQKSLWFGGSFMVRAGAPFFGGTYTGLSRTMVCNQVQEWERSWAGWPVRQKGGLAGWPSTSPIGP